MLKRIFLLKIALCAGFTLPILGCSGGGSGEEEVVVIPETAAPANRVWTVAEIVSEPPRGGAGGAARCGGELGFRRCICAGDVPSTVRYRPSVVECNGNAAAILSGRLADAFSIVVRDTQNRDRWPEAGSGYGGCSFEIANSKSPPAGCSAFKVQQQFVVADGTIRFFCFGEPGYSEIFSDVARMTVKLTDDPFSSEDDIERYCLESPELPLN